MGYTHYWKVENDFEVEDWKELCKLSRKIISLSSVPVQFEDDDNKAPLINNQLIRFNGVGVDGHETFMLSRQAQDFSFCKTARKPYDEIVTAILYAASSSYDFSFTSDGMVAEHADGIALLNRSLKNER